MTASGSTNQNQATPMDVDGIAGKKRPFIFQSPKTKIVDDFFFSQQHEKADELSGDENDGDHLLSQTNDL